MKDYSEDHLKKIFYLLFTLGIFIAMTSGSSLVYADNSNINHGAKVDGY